MNKTLPRTPSDPHRCALCGKTPSDEEVPHKHCSKCKQVFYCGRECQKKDWVSHKSVCQLRWGYYVLHKITKAQDTDQWRNVLQWEEHLNQLLELPTSFLSDDHKISLLTIFSQANTRGGDETGDPIYATSGMASNTRLAARYKKEEMFLEQGHCICDNADIFMGIDKPKDGMLLFEEARVLAEAHELSTVQCRAYMGLGLFHTDHGHADDGVRMLRRAVDIANDIVGDGGISFQGMSLRFLIDALFNDDKATEEVGSLVARLAALRPYISDLSSLQMKNMMNVARLHEMRGNTAQAEQEIRALLAIMASDKKHVATWYAVCCQIMLDAKKEIHMLSNDDGNTDLVESMNSTMQECWLEWNIRQKE